MRMIMAIGSKNLVRIKMMEFILNVAVVGESNRRPIESMAEGAITKVTGHSAEKEKTKTL